MEVTFREISENDLPVIKNIYDWYILNSTATFHTEPISIDQLKDFIYIGHPLYKSYLICSGADVAGYCIITNYKKRPAYDRTAEATIYLRPEFHGMGIGRLALEHLENKAKEVNLKNLIGVISGDNISSIKLFEKSGFFKCAHYKNVGEKFGKVLDVVSYQKELC